MVLSCWVCLFINIRGYLLKLLATFQWLNMAFMTANSGHPDEMPLKCVWHKFAIQTFNIHSQLLSWIKCLIFGLSIQLDVFPIIMDFKSSCHLY